jgi:hypothetical protein
MFRGSVPPSGIDRAVALYLAACNNHLAVRNSGLYSLNATVALPCSQTFPTYK